MVALGVIGFLALFAGIVMLIISAIRKKRLQIWGIVAGLGLVAFIVGVSLSPSAPGPVSTVTETTPTPAPPAPTQPATGTYLINQDVTVGNAAKWKVLTARDRGSVLKASESRYGMFGKDKVTVGKFIEVTFVIENIGGKTENWVDTPTLIDSKNREFETAEAYWEYVPEGLDFLGVTLQPNIPKQAIVIYEVPTDSSELRLKVSDFNLLFPKTALIDLGL